MRIVISGWALTAILLTGCADPGSGETDDRNAIRRGNVGDVTTLDPAIVEETHSFNVLFDIYEGLVAVSESGQIIPGVAESWTVSEDGLVYTFKLRDDAKWSNGEAVTALDFVRSLQRVAAATTLSTYSSLLSPIENFDDVRAGRIDPEQLSVFADADGQLIIRLGEVCPYFLQLMSMPVALPVYGTDPTPEQFKDPRQFVGNGAYIVEKRVLGHSIVLRRNPHYWDAESVRTDKIEYFAIVDELAEFNRYRAGELDVTASVPAGHLEKARREFPDHVRIAPTLALYYMAFDTTEPPFDDARLRKALSMSINRQQLVTLLGRGETPAKNVIPPGIANYAGGVSMQPQTSFANQLSLARELYADAGYGEERPLDLRLVYDAGSVHETIALAVSAMWEDSLGVRVELDKREWKYFLETRSQRSDWDVMRFAWFGDFNDPSTFLDIFRSDSDQNLSGYANADYDEALSTANRSTDPANRSALLRDAEARLLDDLPIAPLYFYVSKRLVNPRIGGFEDNILDRHPSKFLYWRSSENSRPN